MYRTIVFMQGDDYDEFCEHVTRETGEWWPGTAEWVEAAAQYLLQWDYGEPTENEYDSPPWGSADDTYSVDGAPEYTISHNSAMGYVSLTVEFDAERPS